LQKLTYEFHHICCPSVRPQATTRQPTDGFSQNLILASLMLMKCVRTPKFQSESNKPVGTLYKDLNALLRASGARTVTRLAELTPWSTVLLEKLTVPHLLMEFPASDGTRTFITVTTTACRMVLSLARSIESMPPHSFQTHCRVRLPPTRHTPSDISSSASPPNAVCITLSPYVPHSPPIPFFLI
jgi:hypothetical protein